VANAAGRSNEAEELAGDEHVSEFADMIRRMSEAKDPREKDGIRRELAESLDQFDMVHETIRSMVSEAFPPLGFEPPRSLRSRAVTATKEAPARPKGGPPEQPTDDEGNPLTLDPDNPEHAQYIEDHRAWQESQDPPDHLARKMAGAWAERSARASDLAARGYTEADLFSTPMRPGEGEASDGSDDPDAAYREFDRFEASGAAARERNEARRQNVLRATGVDLGMSGGPPRPNTGRNQDINQRDVPTQFDKAPQDKDPMQTDNPPYIDPNQTDYGQSYNRPQGPGQGTGLTEGAIRAQAELPHDQKGPAGPAPGENLQEKIPAESAHPTLGTAESKSKDKPRGGKS
jgi:hypothetical protein